MELPSTEASSVTVQYVTYQVPTPFHQLIPAPMTQEERVARFRHSHNVKGIKVSFQIALIIWALLWGYIALVFITNSLNKDESKASTKDDSSSYLGVIIVVLPYCLLQLFAYSLTLYAVMMVGRKDPCTIRCLVWVSLPMLLVLAGCDLLIAGLIVFTYLGFILGFIPLFILAGNTILLIESIRFLCKLSEIYQDNEVQVAPEGRESENFVDPSETVGRSN